MAVVEAGFVLSGVATDQADVTSGLVVRAQSGDRDALDALVRMHAADVERITSAIVRDADDAADLTQEVWIRVADKIGQLSDPSRFRAWVRRIARNVSLNFLRRADTSADRLDLLDAIDPITTEQNGGWRSTPEGRVMIRDDQRKVWETLGSLNDDDREVLRLREIHELDYAAIAAALGTTPHAAEVRSSRARARFRKRFAVVEEALAWCRENPLRLVAFADREGMRDHGIAHALACATCRERVRAMRVGRGVLSVFGALLVLRDRVSTLLHGGRVAAVSQVNGLVGEGAPHIAAQLPRFVAAAPFVTSVGTVAATVVLGAAAVNVDAAFDSVDPTSKADSAHVATLSQVSADATTASFAISGEPAAAPPDPTRDAQGQGAATPASQGHPAPASPEVETSAPSRSAMPPLLPPTLPLPSLPPATTAVPSSSSPLPAPSTAGSQGRSGDTHRTTASDAANSNASPKGHSDAPPAGSKSNAARSGDRPVQASSSSQDATPQGKGSNANAAPPGQSDGHGPNKATGGNAPTPPLPIDVATVNAPPIAVQTTSSKTEPAGLAHHPVDSGQEVAATNKPRPQLPVAAEAKPKAAPAPKKAST